MTASDLLDRLAASCPNGHVRTAEEGDDLDGLMPSVVARPTDTSDVSRVLSIASEHKLTVTCRGSGTKIDWGGQLRAVDVVLDLSMLSGIVEHNAGDLVVRVRAATPVALLQKALGEKGQRLPLDEVVPGSTVGGVIGTGISGPSRYGLGTVRDLLIGCSVVLADGTAIRAGSKVVKNVAGYDLSKLMAGSFGTLGVVTEATLRLRPLSQLRLYVSCKYEDIEHFAKAHRSIVNSQVAPTAIEVERSNPLAPITMTVALEGRREAVHVRAEQARAVLGSGEISSERPLGFGDLSSTVILKVTSVLSRLAELLGSIDELAVRHRVSPRVAGSAGTGVLYIELDLLPTTDAVKNFIDEVRERCRNSSGTLVVLRSPTELKHIVDIFGEVAGLAIMERIKNEFDPSHLLAPGRFVGAI